VAEATSFSGLVSSKTSPLEIRLDALSCREKRIKRLRRSVWGAGSLHGAAARGHRPDVCHFVTLTYVGVDDWRPDHVAAATERFRRHCARLRVRCRYLWVAELQKRGAVHYHLLVWLPRGVRMPHWDEPTRSPSGRAVAPFWPHGWTQVERARAGVGYLMKYVSKLDGQAEFPHGLRLYGVGGLDQQARAVRAWYNLPEWAKREHGVGDLQRVGSRLVVRETGELLPPMYAREFRPGAIVLHQLREMPPRWHTGPYSRVSFTPS
jgi:hypothetical protein